MRNIGLALTAAVAVLLIVVLPAQAEVYNMDLSQVASSGVSGTATLIVGDIKGATPHHHVELNARLNQLPPPNMVYEGWLVDTQTGYRLSTGAFNGQNLTFREQFVHFEPDTPYDTFVVTLEAQHDANPMPAAARVAQASLPGSMVSEANFMRVAVLPMDEEFQREAITQRFNMTSEQFNRLRMQGWNYNDIALVGNVAVRCNRPPSEISAMLMEGQTWEQIARTCNTTVAMLFEPAPAQAVAGFRAEAPAPGMIQPPMFYQRYPSGAPIVTMDVWEQYWRRGYSWRDVAVAANIAARTGENLDDLLRMTRIQGQTWRQIAIERGLDPDEVMDTRGWPFSRDDSMRPSEMAPMPPPPATTAPPPPGATY